MSLLQRVDSWWNAVTGLGTTRDKRTYSQVAPVAPLTDPEISALFHGNALAHRICSILPSAAFGSPWEVHVDGEGESDAAKALRSAWDALRVREVSTDAQVIDGLTWGRAFGGAGIFLGVDDGRQLDEELGEPRAFEFIHPYDRRALERDTLSIISDPAEKEYGLAQLYRFTPQGAAAGVAHLRPIHATRLVFCPGADTLEQEREQRQGWDMSVLQRPYEELRAYGVGWANVEHLMTEASQGVWKIANLRGMIANGMQAELQRRMEIVELGRNVARGIMVDSDSEDFTRVATSFTGIPDTIREFMSRIAMAADMPVTVLFGVSPAGLNATGESDLEQWDAKVTRYRTEIVGPRMLRILRLLGQLQGIEADRIAIDWKPLRTEKPGDKAAREKLIAEMDQLRIASEVLTPEEVAIHRFKPNGFDDSSAFKIDIEARLAPPPTIAPEPPAAPTGEPVAAPLNGAPKDPVLAALEKA